MSCGLAFLKVASYHLIIPDDAEKSSKRITGAIKRADSPWKESALSGVGKRQTYYVE
jgi:hypothetical protein